MPSLFSARDDFYLLKIIQQLDIYFLQEPYDGKPKAHSQHHQCAKCEVL